MNRDDIVDEEERLLDVTGDLNITISLSVSSLI